MEAIKTFAFLDYSTQYYADIRTFLAAIVADWHYLHPSQLSRIRFQLSYITKSDLR